MEILYSNHHRWLYGWLRRKLGSNCDARNFAHDTYLRILASRDLSGIREPRAYLATVAGGIVANFYRHRAIDNAYLDALLSLPEQECPSPEYRAIMLETLTQNDQLLDGLSSKDRQAFLMAQLEGLTYAEICRELKVSVSMIKQYMLRASRQFYFSMSAWIGYHGYHYAPERVGPSITELPFSPKIAQQASEWLVLLLSGTTTYQERHAWKE